MCQKKVAEYRHYKKLSKNLFVNLEVSEQKSAHCYRLLGKRFQECAERRRNFQQEYYADSSDRGHEYAVKLAEKKSEEALEAYRHLLSKSFNEKSPVADTNPFESLENIQPQLLPQPVSIVPENPSRTYHRKSVHQSLTEEELIMLCRAEQFVARYNNEFMVTNIIFQLISKFVERWLEENGAFGHHGVKILSFVVWMSLGLLGVPLVATEVCTVLLKEKFLGCCFKICSDRQLMTYVEKMAGHGGSSAQSWVILLVIVRNFHR